MGDDSETQIERRGARLLITDRQGVEAAFIGYPGEEDSYLVTLDLDSPPGEATVAGLDRAAVEALRDYLTWVLT